MPSTDSLLLDKNPLLMAALELFTSGIGDGLTVKEVVKQLQTVAICYTAMGVKKNTGEIDTKKREALLVKAYKESVVPGFLRWLNEEAETTTPPWLTMEMMGRITVGATASPARRGKGKEKQQQAKDGEPKLYKDGKKIWARYLDAFRDIRKDVNPVYDEVTGGQHGGTPPSGQQYPDRVDELLQVLWENNCKEKNKTVDMTAEEQVTGGDSSTIDVDRPSTDGEVMPDMEGGGSGALGVHGAAGGGTEREGQTIEQEPINVQREQFDGDSESSSVAMYPERPANWMPYYFLAFCFFGRPSDSEDTDLAMTAGSGPPGECPRKKKGSFDRSSSGGGDGSEGGGSDPAANLGRAGVKQFVGAGEAQSRAQVKKAIARDAAQQSMSSIREEGLLLAKEQAEISKQVAQAVKQVAADVQKGRELNEVEVSRKRQLEEEEACRKRKQGVISDLKGELEFLDPDCEEDRKRRATIKKKIANLYRTKVMSFTAVPDTTRTSAMPAPSSGVASPVAATALSATPATSAAARTTAAPALPGFSGGSDRGFTLGGAVPSAGLSSGSDGDASRSGWSNIIRI